MWIAITVADIYPIIGTSSGVPAVFSFRAIYIGRGWQRGELYSAHD